MGIINVTGIQVYAFHGCMPEEETIGSAYIVDVRIETDFSSALEEDLIKNTVDYVAVHAVVRREMAIRSKLIEHVGGRIARALKKESKEVGKVWVKVAKINPPIGGQADSVSVEVEL
jgi:7,8-dihydroneopterin aldolase/epimerase/oxygenase